MAFELKNSLEVNFGLSVAISELLQDISIEELTRQILTEIDISSSNSPQPRGLKPLPRQGQVPLCLAQERLWFLEQLEPGNPFYNVAIAIQLSGTLDVGLLQQSLNEIIKRHESLRTSFVSVAGQPVQKIHLNLGVKLAIVDFTNLESRKSLDNLILEETQKPFDLSQAPLLRSQLLCLAEDEHFLLLTMHHIISDGWSVGILIQELAEVYQSIREGKAFPLDELPIQYADFAYWQRQELQQELLKTQLNYWKQQLSGNISILELPTDKPRPVTQTFTGKKHNLALSEHVGIAVKNLGQSEGVTLFLTLLTVFEILLYSWSNQEDIIIGTPVIGRYHPETQKLIGFFINTLVLRTDLSGNPTFRELLKRVKKVVLEAYDHQDVPFEKLVEELQPKRNLSYNPLFQVMFIFQNTSIASIKQPELKWEPQEIDNGTSKFDLKLNIWESSAGFQGSFEYKTDLFESTTISRIASNFEVLLQAIISQPNIRIQELTEVVKTVEKQQIIFQKQKLETIGLQKLKLAKRTGI
jgi:Condensation domain